MFYRQKILLAMTEVSGKRVGNTDLQKLLFLYCQETQQNHYDFFPYQFGAFSFISYFDKRKLIEQGYLKNVDYFELTASSSYIYQLKPKDHASLREFAAKTKSLRDQKLIHKAYLEYPEYASKSTIINKILSPKEQDKVRQSWSTDLSPTLFTIGYEGSTIDDYIRRLTINNVRVLIDVRRNPLSRKHGFSKKRMQHYLERVGIQYHHIPELGIESHLRKNLSDKASYIDLFDLYAKTVLPDQSIALDKITEIASKHGRVALTCFEADPCMCHRHKITERLKENEKFNFPIVHI
ncbi:hypothetical protein MNBD_CHLOROFLEXI01-322 [hydrothermal vent metagenome]|uniref:DUF488 domain-containing protein n=1 Tax=hydrothermal vent metagenome TaxID=652676 RepID=A0A3B0VCU8_9ZZZZ